MQNIILLHGALGASEDLRALGEALKKRGLVVYSFSFSGHGKTIPQKKFEISQFAAELDDFIHVNKLHETNVFGYSMGGYVALTLALTLASSPALKSEISKIITLGTKFNWSEEAVEKETKQLNPEIIASKAPAFAKMLEEKHGETWGDLLHKTAGMMKKIGQENILNVETLKQIKIPVLIGIADNDKMVSLDETVNVFKNLPAASMYMLPGAKHQLETANTNLLSHVICDFIQN